MKNTLRIIVLLSFIGMGAKAQKEVLLKMRVAPNHHYSMLMDMNMNMEMNVSGDSAMVQQMKSSGQSFPMLMTIQSGTNNDIKTGSVNAENKIPFTMTMKALSSKMTMNGQDSPIPMPATNETMFGMYTADGKMSIDSISGKKADDALKAAMVKMINGIQSVIKFPEKPIKVGDSFTQDLPFDLPMSGISSKLVCKITYKLTGIQNNKAYFDLVYDIVMDMAGDLSGQSMAVNMKGGGDGKMVYDIPANYPTTMQNNMNLNYSMTMPQAANMKMDGKMKMIMNNNTTISSN